MYMFPLFRWGNCRWLAAGHSLWVAWSGQYTVMSQPIWCTIDWLGTQQHRELGRVSRSRVLLWLVTSPQASPEPSNHRRGWVWVFFLALNRWFLHQLPSSQHPTSRPLSTDFWYHTCGVRANAKVEVSRMPWLQRPAMCSRVIMLLTKWLKLENSLTPPPCSNTQWNRWPNSGKLLIKVFKLMSRRKLRNSEMDKKFLGYGRSGVGGASMTSWAENPHLRTICSPFLSSLSQYWWICAEVSLNRHKYWTVSRWCWSQSQWVPSSLPTGTESSNL